MKNYESTIRDIITNETYWYKRKRNKRIKQDLHKSKFFKSIEYPFLLF